MLGFDAYTKSNFGAILEQRIRIFFSKRLLVNYPVILQIQSSNNTAEINTLIDTTFATFKKELENKKLYYHYSVSSLLLDNPDYDFLTNNEQDTIELANESIFNIYSQIVKDILNTSNSQQTATQSESQSEELFSFLEDQTYHRLIPSYSDPGFANNELKSFKEDLLDFQKPPAIATFDEAKPGVNEFKAPGSPAMAGLSLEEKEENEKLRFADNGVNVPISRIPSPFYIEYFWRLQPANKQTYFTEGSQFFLFLANIENQQLEFGKKRGNLIQNFKELRQKYYYMGAKEREQFDEPNNVLFAEYTLQRGVRLMYNLTAFIDETNTLYYPTIGSETYNFRLLRPQQWTPFQGIDNYKNVPIGDQHPFPLPFLTGESPTVTGFDQTQGSFLQNAYLKMARTKSPGKMKAKDRNRNDPAGITLKNNLYFTNDYGVSSGGKIFNINRNYYWAYNEIQNLYPSVDFFKMRASKSLISFEIEQVKTGGVTVADLTAADPGFIGDTTYFLNLYFPIILAEEVSEEVVKPSMPVADQIPAFQELVKKLLSDNKQVKYLRSVMDYNKTSEFLSVKKTNTPSPLISILEKNEKNLQVMMNSEPSAKEAEAFYNSIPEPLRSVLFPNGPVYEKAVFFDTAETENNLDNLLLNLINFDEET